PLRAHRAGYRERVRGKSFGRRHDFRRRFRGRAIIRLSPGIAVVPRVLAEPGPVALQALLDVVASPETGRLQLSDLLVELREPCVLVRAGPLAAAGPHDGAPSWVSPSNG